MRVVRNDPTPQSTSGNPWPECGRRCSRRNETDYGCHTWERQSFLDVLSEAKGGKLPPADWTAHGLSKDEAGSAAASLMISERPIDAMRPREHWGQVLAAHGLVPVAVKTGDHVVNR